ncbi:MAG: hypothetical protein ACOX9C_04330 [Kiritimatiellia bacterium]|jgi:hypothetical protein
MAGIFSNMPKEDAMLLAGLACFLFVLLVIGVAHGVASKVAAAKRRRLDKERRVAAHRRFQAMVEAAERAGGLDPVASPILLRKGESAYWAEPSNLYETRAVRRAAGGGVSVSVGRGVVLHSGGGQSRSTQEWQHIASGTLVVTDKRIVFDGAGTDRVVRLDKLLSVDGSAFEIEVSAESRQKSMVFTSANGFYVEWLVRQLTLNA